MKKKKKIKEKGKGKRKKIDDTAEPLWGRGRRQRGYGAKAPRGDGWGRLRRAK